ncbi:copper-translocating P-type ATPase [Phormidium sp. LEGE 05292]|uniref:heavy metal translocating P-type ATPase n=1 Tax=[Phormidium] sp. LEGE 05292 TaxID=767427 RepID=UPI00187ECDFA|nr:heavy metal translocating P-type ATPase [Phormidium sp. LEGE 05292]MBE9224221.1 copper-translocating P-type ATPase [Phormidium sp. LEGE 05292]
MQVKSELAIANSDSKSETITLDVTGMKCAGCVKAVENQLTQHPDVISACVNLITEVAVCEVKSGKVEPYTLAAKLTDAGFPSQPRTSENQLTSSNYVTPAERHRQAIKSSIRQLIIAAILIFLSGIGHFTRHSLIPGEHSTILTSFWFHWGLATATLLGPGRSILVDGWRGLRHNSPNMNTLVGLGAFTAYTASTIALLFPQLGWECFFDEPVMLLGFILLGRTLEQQARVKAASAFEALVSLQPRMARLIADPSVAAFGQNSVEIPADQVRVGEFLQVLPGEKIPVDGEVVEGKTTVNESMLTGEAIPVSKKKGDAVAAGTLNQSGAIAIRATRTGKDTTLAQIVSLVETAQIRKAPVQRLADTVAGYFTYGVITIATLTFLFWYFAGTRIWPDVLVNGAMSHGTHHLTHQLSPLLLSLKLAIAVLVVACPCSLGLATPTAILVGTGIGAEQGLLIKGGDVLERVSALDTVVFDKTGTLTSGYPTLTDCIPSQDLESNSPLAKFSLLQLAAAAESGSRHPLGSAINQAATQAGLFIPAAEDFYTEPGQGVSARVEQQLVLVGTETWLQQHGVTIDPSLTEKASILGNAGKTIVYVAAGNCLFGLIAFTDSVRPDAAKAVEALRQLGLRVMMLTGDRQKAALVVAEKLGIDAVDILAQVQPDGKAQTVAALQSQGHRVAMIGDGINDAPALAQADVGIAMHAGTDVAIESAQIILMRDAVMDIVASIQLSRATFNKIRQNLFWALAYNILGIPLAAGILLPNFGVVLNPAAAGAMMAFSSVSVVTNSLLLRRLPRSQQKPND